MNDSAKSSIDWPPLPDMGVYFAWPAQGIEAIHPDDRQVAEQLIPSDRVLHRVAFDGTYYTLQYGEQSFRIRPSLWLQIADEGFRIGDRVEVAGRMMQAEPMIATISEMHYSQDKGAIEYTLDHHEMPLPKCFLAEELVQLTHHEHLRPRDFDAPIPKQIDPGDGLSTLPLELDAGPLELDAGTLELDAGTLDSEAGPLQPPEAG